MTRTRFTRGWTVRPNVSVFSMLGNAVEPPRAVTLPHDAMITMPRTADAPSGASSGYFPGGAVTYERTLDVPEQWRERRVWLEFDGVYRDAGVFVNGSFVGQRANGYVPFHVPLDAHLHYGEPNIVRVDARAHQDSRWYSGLGLHREVNLIVSPLVHLDPWGVRVTTPDVDTERAVVEVETLVRNASPTTVTREVVLTIRDAAGRDVATTRTPITLVPSSESVVRRRLTVEDPDRWGVDHPTLYTAVATLDAAAGEPDAVEATFGIRTLQVDPRRGLRINGESVLLRGACIHHDNGVLGSASIACAEERRVRRLKAAGFNSIRSAHNPLSSALLAACDRLGMLVMDEAFDMWAESKQSFDYAQDFPVWGEADLEAMVMRDRNHPSVIVYSIGNEILEVARPLGATIGRRLAEHVRTLDATRFITNGISGHVANLPYVIQHFAAQLAGGNANDLAGEISDLLSAPETKAMITRSTAESHAALDIAGLNYAHELYAEEVELYPDRIVVGTESLPKNIAAIWATVTENPHVIGDFTWTGWDYLGEAGLGATVYVDDDASTAAVSDYPALLAWCGDIDITGYRRPASYYREIVFGLTEVPYIAVRRPGGEGRTARTLDWAWTDTTGTWTWDVADDTPLEVEVYAASDTVRLEFDGRTVGTAPAGADHDFRARFTVPYRSGELVAVALDDGREVARRTLRTARGDVRLALEVERTDLVDDDTDLAFVEIELVDATGQLDTAHDREVSVEVVGAGVLAGYGTARPALQGSPRYDGDTQTTFEGRALAVVRPTEPGTIAVRVHAAGLDDVEVTLTVT